MKTNFLLCLCICVIAFLGCREYESSVSSAIAKKVSRGEGTIINLSELTSFKWDRLYIFDPYESRDTIQNLIGQRFLKTNELSMGVSEGDTLLVFMKDNKVAHYFMHPRGKGDFSGLGKDNWFTPQNAKFQVIQEGYSLRGKWLKLKVIEWKKE
ncbi:MAG: hypothetical protein HZA10_08010 [Nitrospirae bacterium]|nr:hypothetical protein [Nitrospirota bacterium]